LCIYFPITDPGSSNKAPVSVERPDWMKFCNESGFAKYVGREEVDGVWADHWSCHIEYTQVNQSITFQNWHSLGLSANIPKGLPVRVTGGNSAPNPTKGSPRLNSVWYSNFVTGDGAFKPDIFNKPSWACIPVMLESSQVTEFFGEEPSVDKLFSADFHKRAHWAPHIEPTEKDSNRAQSTPQLLRGSDFGDAMDMLNKRLVATPGLHTRECSRFSVEELEQVQEVLHEARSPVFDQIYQKNNDTRALRLSSRSRIEQEFAEIRVLLAKRPELYVMVRDGLCHETVMLYTHHLSESARQEAAQLVVLPLMPSTHHVPPAKDDAAMAAHATYTTQVSCAVCHVM